MSRLTLHIAGTAAHAKIRDSGHRPPQPPAATAPDGLGMGLQVARRICDQVTIHRDANGSTVILQMSLPDTTPPARG